MEKEDKLAKCQLGKMKKITSILLAIVLTLTVFGVSASALFSSGAQVMADEVTMVKTGLSGKKLTFSDSDFKSALCIPDFNRLTVETLPSSTEGTLLLAGRRVSEGQSIKRKNVGALVFVPASSEVTESSFTFSIDKASGGAVYTCVMKFIDRINYAPRPDEATGASPTLTTQSTISVYGRISAEDPEGDELEFIIASYPKEGILTLNDNGDGGYKYTPIGSFTGYDSFTYVVRDSYGNYSEPVKVSIKVVERMSSVVFVDMTDKESYNAAVAMNAMGVMSGQTVGDDVYFLPEKTVSRAEFVAMAMKAVGMRPDSSLKASFFDDNDQIPKSLVSYVATAQRAGIIDGDFGKSGLVFRPSDTITGYEAARIMAALMGIEDETEETVFEDINEVPVWARSSVSAMYTLGIFEYSEVGSPESINVTRADAAEFLYRMVNTKI